MHPVPSKDAKKFLQRNRENLHSFVQAAHKKKKKTSGRDYPQSLKHSLFKNSRQRQADIINNNKLSDTLYLASNVNNITFASGLL